MLHASIWLCPGNSDSSVSSTLFFVLFLFLYVDLCSRICCICRDILYHLLAHRDCVDCCNSPARGTTTCLGRVNIVAVDVTYVLKLAAHGEGAVLQFTRKGVLRHV